MENQGVVFKGTKNGVIVKVKNETSFESVSKAIRNQLHKSKDFFKSGEIYLDLSEANIESKQEVELKNLVYRDYGVCIRSIHRKKTKVFNDINEGITKFINGTIRSGQGLEFDGNVVIIGDVNAGGQVKAGGNIVVLGALRGVVHAGASGNKKAIIAAFSLQPIQLRIANLISRPPDGETMKPAYPELARIKDGLIVIEPYALNTGRAL